LWVSLPEKAFQKSEGFALFNKFPLSQIAIRKTNPRPPRRAPPFKKGAFYRIAILQRCAQKRRLQDLLPVFCCERQWKTKTPGEPGVLGRNRVGVRNTYASIRLLTTLGFVLAISGTALADPGTIGLTLCYQGLVRQYRMCGVAKGCRDGGTGRQGAADLRITATSGRRRYKATGFTASQDAGACVTNVTPTRFSANHQPSFIDADLNFRANSVHFTEATHGLGTGDIVLILGNGDGGQNADDGDHDHQFDQGKALLLCFHDSFLSGCVEQKGQKSLPVRVYQKLCHERKTG
jgi:hypothetical protein